MFTVVSPIQVFRKFSWGYMRYSAVSADGSSRFGMFNPHPVIQSPYLNRFFPMLRGVRMRFKGKTIRARRILWRQYTFKVGLSHPTVAFLSFGVGCRMRLKQRMVLWSFSLHNIRSSTARFKKLKRINLYHARGIRCVRQSRF